jgi:hypothetical protein
MKELVQLTTGAFPNKRINEEKTIDAWMYSLSDYDPMLIQAAIINHMATSIYFPTPKELKKNIQRAILTQPAPEKTFRTKAQDQTDNDKRLEAILEDFL